nr:stalk domain-containing protein [Paenibacillus cellulosilyticus]
MLPSVANAQTTTSKPVKVQTSAFELVFDGKTVNLPDGQFIFVNQGTSYVPVRFISYALQKKVVWDSATKKVTVTEPSANELTVLREYLMNAAGEKGKQSSVGGTTVTASPISAAFVFDGVARNLPAGQSAFIVNNSIYVPVRFMSESIGTQIKWDSANHRISGESKSYREEQQSNGDDGGKSDGSTGGEQGTNNGTSSGNGTGAGSAGGSGVVNKPTYEQIKSEADSKLESLYNSAKSSFLSLAQQYLSATDKAAKQTIYAQGEAYLSDITSQFNAILSDTEAKLTANGYSTAIIQEYRNRFDSEIAAGRQTLAAMMK